MTRLGFARASVQELCVPRPTCAGVWPENEATVRSSPTVILTVDDSVTMWGPKCSMLAIAVLLIGSAGVFFVIGALGEHASVNCRACKLLLYAWNYETLLCTTSQGPPATEVHYHTLYLCLLPIAKKATRDVSFNLIDDDTCSQNGRSLDVETARGLQAYPPSNVVFYAQIPHKKNHVMTRYFQFLLADLGIHFSTSDYPKRLMGECWI